MYTLLIRVEEREREKKDPSPLFNKAPRRKEKKRPRTTLIVVV